MSANPVAADAEPAWAAEQALLNPATRRDRSELERLLAPGFREIGQSGQVWTRDETIDALLLEAPATTEPVLTDRHQTALGGGLWMLTYRLEVHSGVSLRSSLWRIGSEGATLEFHQGTPVPGL